MEPSVNDLHREPWLKYALSTSSDSLNLKERRACCEYKFIIVVSQGAVCVYKKVKCLSCTHTCRLWIHVVIAPFPPSELSYISGSPAVFCDELSSSWMCFFLLLSFLKNLPPTFPWLTFFPSFRCSFLLCFVPHLFPILGTRRKVVTIGAFRLSLFT